MLRAGVALLVLALGVAGCGAGHAAHHASSDGSAGQPGGPDRVAYYQLAVAVGFLQASAAGARHARAGGDPARGQLPLALGRLAELTPLDPLLRRARVQLQAAIRRWLSAPGRPGGARRRVAAATLENARPVVAALGRFLREHPAEGSPLPD